MVTQPDPNHPDRCPSIMSDRERAERLEAMCDRMTGKLAAVQEALQRAEAIEPQGSSDWVESGRAMKATVLREIRAALGGAE